MGVCEWVPICGNYHESIRLYNVSLVDLVTDRKSLQIIFFGFFGAAAVIVDVVVAICLLPLTRHQISFMRFIFCCFCRQQNKKKRFYFILNALENILYTLSYCLCGKMPHFIHPHEPNVCCLFCIWVGACNLHKNIISRQRFR